jgi:hypothetical protein
MFWFKSRRKEESCVRREIMISFLVSFNTIAAAALMPITRGWFPRIFPKGGLKPLFADVLM